MENVMGGKISKSELVSSTFVHIFSAFVNYIHIIGNQTLPHTFSPEYKAAQRAYMRYHNMEPIFGVSSKYVLVVS
jgi:hypothetical protein